MTEPVDEHLLEVFGDSGALARSDPNFLPREGQQQLAQAVARAIAEPSALVAEAGTGVGKTFAYLVPLLLSGKRALVSTATKSLQDQLFLRDLPRLAKTLAVPVRMALLKGRGSYLCRHRLAQARDTAQLPDRFAVRALARIETWAQSTRSGDMADVEGLDDRSPVIPLVTSTRENCLGSDCPEFRACHVMQARREAMAADLVVVNHHLFFADMSLRDSGVAELLPTVDVAIFDEAHQLVDAGVQFLGSTLGTSQAIDLARDMLAIGLSQARGLRAWNELSTGIERAARDLRLACAGSSGEVRGSRRLRWEDRAQEPALAAALVSLRDAVQAAADGLNDVVATSPDFARLQQRCAALVALVEGFAAGTPDDHVRWIDLSAQQARLVETPLDIRQMLTEQRQSSPKAWIFTSATLGDDAGLTWFTASTGLEDAATLKVASPFDYARNARLWVPARFPRPNEPAHAQAVGELAANCAHALHGRTFVLTTTLRVLPAIAEALRVRADALACELEILVQGSQPRRTLLQRFGDGRGRVLIGSQSFWEGIDMPGETLQCVIIDKLPFPPPNDPLVEARVRQLESQQRNAFNEYFVAEAAVSLKQGAGRLIRSETDRGLLVVCDPRLQQMGYGVRLRAALPPMTPVQSEAEALAWLTSLSAGR